MRLPTWLRRFLLWVLRNAPELAPEPDRAFQPEGWITLAFRVTDLVDPNGERANRVFWLGDFDNLYRARSFLANATPAQLERFGGAYYRAPVPVLPELSWPETLDPPQEAPLQAMAWTVDKAFLSLENLLAGMTPFSLHAAGVCLKAGERAAVRRIGEWFVSYAVLLQENLVGKAGASPAPEEGGTDETG